VQSVAIEVCFFVESYITQKVDRRPISFLYRSLKELNERGLALSMDKVHNTHYDLVPLNNLLYIHSAFMLPKLNRWFGAWDVQAKIQQVQGVVFLVLV
jgi:hypothetical protein